MRSFPDVQGVGVATIGDGKVLSFALSDPESVKKPMDFAQRARAVENEAAGVSIVMIPQRALNPSVDVIRTVKTRVFLAAG